MEGALARLFEEGRRLGRAPMDDAGLKALGEMLGEVALDAELLDEDRLPALHASRAAAGVVQSDGPDGLTLMLARFSELEATPVHDHGSWGVVRVVRGRDRYTTWRREDAGNDPDRARLVRVDDEELGPGDVVFFHGPPHDIHSQQGIGGPVLELVLFGRDTTRIPRHYFNVETGTIRTALPQ